MKEYLNNHYPFYYNLKTSLLIGTLIFIMATLFSCFFEPFEVGYSELKYNYFTISLIHSLVSFIVFFISVLVLNKIISEKLVWKIKHELMFLFTVLVIIGFFQFLIRDFIYDKDDNWSLRYLYEEIRNALLVGGLLIFVLISIIERSNSAYYNKRKNRIKFTFEEPVQTENKVAIKTKVKSDDFLLSIDDFKFAKADKNYVDFYLHNDNTLLKRITIKSLEIQLSEYNFILKTHRSFIVNLKTIVKIEGNAQGYTLFIKDSENTVPVSRKMLSIFQERMNTVNI